MKKNLKTLLFIAVLSLFTGSFFAQSDKPLNELSIKELEKEAKNNPDAQVLMGDKYLATVIDIRNHSDLNEQKAAYNKAYKYYLKAAKVNNPKGQFGVGKAIKYLRDGSADDRIFPGEEDVLSWYQKAADQNLAEAQFEFGNIYRQGGYDYGPEKNIIPRNINTSIEYYHKAAEQNYPEAQYELAMIYKYSKSGIKKDFEKYKFWMFKAADNDYYKAQNELAMDYMANYFSENLEQALIWAKKAYDKIPTEFRMTNLDGYDIWHMNVYDKIKKAIYENSRYKEAAKQGSEGIAKLEKLREKEMSDWNKAYDEREKQRVNELADYRNQIRNEKTEREADAEKEYQKKKSAQADQQRILDAQDKKLQQGYREINAMANPTSIDAINLAAENRAKNAAFYESVERNKKAEEENSSSNSNSRTASNDSSGNSTSSNSNSSNSSNGNSNSSDVDKNSNRQRKRHFKMEFESEHSGFYTNESPGFLSISEACENAKSLAVNAIITYSGGKILNFSVCSSKMQSIGNCDIGEDQHDPYHFCAWDKKDVRVRYICKVTADIEINENSRGLPLPAGVYYEGERPN